MNRSETLASLFAKEGVAASVDEYRCVIINYGPIHVFIQMRPFYCDRGRWQVNAESNDIKICIDGADMFPRYYFHDDCLVSEIVTWLEVRMANYEKDNARAT